MNERKKEYTRNQILGYVAAVFIGVLPFAFFIFPNMIMSDSQLTGEINYDDMRERARTVVLLLCAIQILAVVVITFIGGFFFRRMNDDLIEDKATRHTQKIITGILLGFFCVALIILTVVFSSWLSADTITFGLLPVVTVFTVICLVAMVILELFVFVPWSFRRVKKG